MLYCHHLGRKIAELGLFRYGIPIRKKTKRFVRFGGLHLAGLNLHIKVRAVSLFYSEAGLSLYIR